VRLFARRKRDCASWLAWPTLSAGGGGQIKAAGVYYHKDGLRQAIAHYGSLAMAELRIEPDGQYAGAIRVIVGDIMLGSIPHGLADEFREAVEQLHKAGLMATCRASLEADLNDDQTYVDVFLWASPKPRSADEPFFPPGLGEVVRLDAGQAERLEESLHSRAKKKRVVKSGELLPTSRGWGVVLDDQEIGILGSSAYKRVTEARAAGFPLTCRVRLLREPEQPLRVMADLPSD
jgi:hypothetical protein